MFITLLVEAEKGKGNKEMNKVSAEEKRKHHTEWVQNWYKNHPEKYATSGIHRADYKDVGYPKLRVSILTLLGGKCSKCGVDNYRILQVNHLDGGGRQEISEWTNRTAFYRAVLKKKRAVDDLNLLCCNCNILYEHEQGRRKIGHPMHSRLVHQLGGKCSKCGVDDERLLQINHLNGKEVGEYKTFNNWDFYRSLIQGKMPISEVNLLCANCNTLYEYERGNRSTFNDYLITINK